VPRPLLPLALVLALLLGACTGGSDDPAPGPTGSPDGRDGATAWQRADVADVRAGGTLRLAVAAYPVTFNPWHADAVGTEVERLLAPTTGGVVRLTADGGWEVDPDHAREVEVVEEDPLTVRVRLNPDAVWQGGTPVTAADMRATWQALRGADDAYAVAGSDGWDDVADVRTGRDRFTYTVRFDVRRPDWPLFVSPRLPRSVASSPRRFDRGYVERPLPSNGPFVVTDVDEATGTITQERNPRWWGRTPRLQRIVWRVAEPAVQAEAFAAEELDVATLDAEGYPEVDTARVQRATGSQWSHLTLNAGRGALRDVDVRRAVAAALDRTALAEQVAEPLGADPRTADSLLVLPDQEGYADVAQPRRRDLDEARSLLRRAGYEVTGGDEPRATRDGKVLTLTMPVAADAPTIAARAKAVAGQLADVGIRVRVRTVPADAFATRVLLPLDFDLLTFSWGPSLLGPESARDRFRPVTSPSNLTGVASPAGPWDAVLAARGARARTAATADLETALRREAVVVPLVVTPTVLAVREGVVNVGASSFEQPDWTTVGFRAAD
jgi:peptide/nickel transport system substrate-binding protein